MLDLDIVAYDCQKNHWILRKRNELSKAPVTEAIRRKCSLLQRGIMPSLHVHSVHRWFPIWLVLCFDRRPWTTESSLLAHEFAEPLTRLQLDVIRCSSIIFFLLYKWTLPILHVKIKNQSMFCQRSKFARRHHPQQESSWFLLCYLWRSWIEYPDVHHFLGPFKHHEGVIFPRNHPSSRKNR